MQEQITYIYTQYMSDIYRYCFARLGNKEQAEDITAETFLSLMAVHDISGIENIKLWLIGVARNKLIDKYRRAEAKVLSDVEIEVAENLVPEEADTLENIHIEAELLKEIQAELKNLDENLREVLVLKHWEDLKFNEMALILGISENTVKSRYYNALETIKNNINKKSRKKMRAISIPLLFLALPKIKADAAFAPTTQFTSNLINLVIKSNMSRFVLWIKAHKLAVIVATCVAVGVLLASVIILLANNTGNGTTAENISSSSSSQSSSVTTTSVAKDLKTQIFEAWNEGDAEKVARIANNSFEVRKPGTECCGGLSKEVQYQYLSIYTAKKFGYELALPYVFEGTDAKVSEARSLLLNRGYDEKYYFTNLSGVNEMVVGVSQNKSDGDYGISVLVFNNGALAIVEEFSKAYLAM